MKINQLGQDLLRNIGAKSTEKTAKTENLKSGSENTSAVQNQKDRVMLQGTGELKHLVEIVLSTSDSLSSASLQEIQSQIENGSFEPDIQGIVEGMLADRSLLQELLKKSSEE